MERSLTRVHYDCVGVCSIECISCSQVLTIDDGSVKLHFGSLSIVAISEVCHLPFIVNGEWCIPRCSGVEFIPAFPLIAIRVPGI